ncbi:MAG: bifunctional phosphoribosylaminoimidazolecarboxamide formyltransferase/IMP cyclohydrolase [Bacteroidales bacterium]|nr:bifunctional phosphoribosylaminoimidazolecarboxamide formyltransferase/IMP cyclohydrolase [Bacteroidales bacterium]MCL2133839.1 bifunctional phosphoribosylaminoimidazolecarboxamide formyltransferase/IMP cyclohydrolase [Bacteroidales bacterium]
MNSSGTKTIKRALLSVYYKDKLEYIIHCLHRLRVEIYATGGTLNFIRQIGHKVQAIETLTGYPSILEGRVKTLHPKVFGGILARSGQVGDSEELQQYEIPAFDLVVVDLYPFEETVKNGKSEQEIIEKIDIGGISLIRAAAKNHADVLVIASRNQYDDLLQILNEKEGTTSLAERRSFAAQAFQVSSHYDSAIFNYFNQAENIPALRVSCDESMALRYGENPHQQGRFYGRFNELFDQLHGKEISYNNLLDIDAAVQLIDEFDDDTAVAILKHNNACGMAVRSSLSEAWSAALAADPLSAFGGVIITNNTVDAVAAEAINNIFFEVIIAPEYEPTALDILQQRKNRIILLRKNEHITQKIQYRSLLNGVLAQDTDLHTVHTGGLKTVTNRAPSAAEIEDLIFANKLVKHTKSNAIVLVKNQQLCGSGVGQTSRVDAMKQAIEKASTFGFDLQGAVMASDAFFPFPDCVEIACKVGITAVIHPGGSIKDQDSIDYCNQHKIAMVTTGIRHFKH